MNTIPEWSGECVAEHVGSVSRGESLTAPFRLESALGRAKVR